MHACTQCVVASLSSAVQPHDAGTLQAESQRLPVVHDRGLASHSCLVHSERGLYTANSAAIMYVFILQDSEGDMLLAKEGTPEHAAEAQSEQQGLNVRQGGGVTQSTERQAEQSRKMQPVQQPQQSHQAASINYDSLPRPSPYPLEGDVIAYRLLHIGADWTPQVNLLPAPSFLPRGDRSSTLYPACCML